MLENALDKVTSSDTAAISQLLSKFTLGKNDLKEQSAHYTRYIDDLKSFGSSNLFRDTSNWMITYVNTIKQVADYQQMFLSRNC